MIRRSVTFALLAVGLVVGLAGPAQASVASNPGTAGCVMVVGKAPARGMMSPVKSYECYSSKSALAVANASGTLLMTWYTKANYGGSSTSVRENDGPCDATGYGISYVGSSWNDKIQSWKVWNECLFSSDFQNSNYGGECDIYNGNVAVRDSFDSWGISSFLISQSPYAWDQCQ